MPGQTRPVADERDGLLSFLAQVRYQLKLTGYGLTPEQLRASPSVSVLSVGGLIKHAAHTEAGWLDAAVQRPPAYPPAYEWTSTSTSLMAAAEGWPESDYLKPWTPSAS